jgi:hypothetical protein
MPYRGAPRSRLEVEVRKAYRDWCCRLVWSSILVDIGDFGAETKNTFSGRP